MRICDVNEPLRHSLGVTLSNYGSRDFQRHETLVTHLVQSISPHNLIFSGRWDTVVTTLLQLFAFRGWLNIIHIRDPRDL